MNPEKPVLFISHATSDGEFAQVLKQGIDRVFASGIAVFCTSSPGAIPVGRDWLADIEEKLNRAKAVIAVITPISLERPWLWFEVGATWSKGHNGDCRIYPLCVPEVDLGHLPSPLDRLQALSLGKAQDVKLLFQELIAQFGFGSLTGFKTSNITGRIPKYKSVKVAAADAGERRLYSGPFSRYSDEELMEVLDEHYFLVESKSSGFCYGRGIAGGALIHYQVIDDKLRLPPGTARRLLNSVAKRYLLEPIQESENLVRYRYKE